MSGSLVNKTNSQYSKSKLLHYNPPIAGCGNMRGGSNNNLSTARYGFINGDNNRMYAGSHPEMSSTSKPMSCKLVGGKRSRRRGKNSKKKTMRKIKRTAVRRKRPRVKKSRKTKKLIGKKLLKKWINQIKKFRKKSLKGGSKSQTTSHFVHQTPGTTSLGKVGMLANPTTYSVSNSCIDNYNHYKQN